LPKENLNPGELKQKEQYEAGLKTASEPQVIKISGAAGGMPWDCAKALKPELISRRAEMVTSSVST
jgi:stress-induced-phosphoprotein 1